MGELTAAGTARALERRAAEIEAMAPAERAALAARVLRLLRRLRGAGRGKR